MANSPEITTLAQAWREFCGKRAPWVIAAGLAAALAVRIAFGGPATWRDAVALVAMALIYPFGEWAIHVYLLHLKPFTFRGRRVDLVTARAHREHHEEPNDLGLVNFSPREALAIMLLAVPLVLGLGAAVTAPLPGSAALGPFLTAAATAYALVYIYEWVHFLIHTAYRPRSRYYRSIWRGHRLHHFKNENYWHGITNTVSDRVLGTFPDQRDVERSRTARALHADG